MGLLDQAKATIDKANTDARANAIATAKARDDEIVEYARKVVGGLTVTLEGREKITRETVGYVRRDGSFSPLGFGSPSIRHKLDAVEHVARHLIVEGEVHLWAFSPQYGEINFVIQHPCKRCKVDRFWDIGLSTWKPNFVETLAAALATAMRTNCARCQLEIEGATCGCCGRGWETGA